LVFRRPSIAYLLIITSSVIAIPQISTHLCKPSLDSCKVRNAPRSWADQRSKLQAQVIFSTMGRRNTSNVPAQALILMNDPYVVGQASAWAERALERNTSVESRIDWMYLTAFARQPTRHEKAVAAAFLTAEASGRGILQSDIDLWADFAHALINTKEFIFLR